MTQIRPITDKDVPALTDTSPLVPQTVINVVVESEDNATEPTPFESNNAYTYVTGLLNAVNRPLPTLLMVSDVLKDGLYSLTAPVGRLITEFLQTFRVEKQ